MPLLVAGALSIVYWQATGDLRLYGIVQFFPAIAIPAMLLLFAPRYSHSGGVWAMVGFYALARIAELLDRPIGAVIATGGHPWKHVLAGAAIFAYCASVARRRAI